MVAYIHGRVSTRWSFHEIENQLNKSPKRARSLHLIAAACCTKQKKSGNISCTSRGPCVVFLLPALTRSSVQQEKISTRPARKKGSDFFFLIFFWHPLFFPKILMSIPVPESTVVIPEILSPEHIGSGNLTSSGLWLDV